MNPLEQRMMALLTGLKENYGAIGAKVEFEEEGASFEDAFRLKEMLIQADLDLTIKIGGCKAINEMNAVKRIGANAIVAPMIETPYAVKEYFKALKSVFLQDELQDIETFINIETITGYLNFDEIMSLSEAEELSGIVFGRGDMVRSLGLTKDEINSEEMLGFSNSLARKTYKYGKNFIIGGGVSSRSLPFFKKLPENYLNKIETRKIIFNAQKLLKMDKAKEGILKAIEFELMWIKNKREFYGVMHDYDSQRIITLENCYKKSLQEFELEII